MSEVRNKRGMILLKFLKIAALVVVVLVAGSVVYSYSLVKSLEKKMQLEPKEAAEVKKETTEPKKGEPRYILLVGADKRPDWKAARADVIMILRVDPNSKKAHLLSIPRDSRVEILGQGPDKINHSLAYGGAPLLIATVECYTDLEMNYYFQVDMASFSEMVDAVGGVYLNVDKNWEEGLRGTGIRAGYHKRNGKEALALLQPRTYPGGDFVRIKHQQYFIAEAMKQMMTSYTNIPGLASIVASHTKTNMDMGEMIGLGRTFMGSDVKLQTAIVPGKTGMIKGVSYVFPDEKAMNELIEAMKEGKDFPTGVEKRGASSGASI
ncbi:MAG: LCP family protein [Actinobacteria bacterium]|nr:LCP family protein [Actinomycetota bacterium]